MGAAEPLLPPELQQAIGAQPAIEPQAAQEQPVRAKPAPAAAPEIQSPAPALTDEPSAYDYIPLDPHEPKG